MPREAAGGHQEQPQANLRGANPAREAWAWASVSSSWPPAKPDKNYTRHVPAIARTTSAWRYSAISARDGSRSVTANCMRHRPQQSRHPRQPESKITKAPPHSSSVSTQFCRPEGWKRTCSERRPVLGGTGSSNPCSSAGESVANLIQIGLRCSPRPGPSFDNLVGAGQDRGRREKSRDAVFARAGYSADRFGTCCSA